MLYVKKKRLNVALTHPDDSMPTMWRMYHILKA